MKMIIGQSDNYSDNVGPSDNYSDNVKECSLEDGYKCYATSIVQKYDFRFFKAKSLYLSVI